MSRGSQTIAGPVLRAYSSVSMARYNDPMKWSLWNLMVLAMVGPPLLSAVNSQVRGNTELSSLVILGWLFAIAILVDRPKSHH